MKANALDAEIRKFLPLLGNKEKLSLLDNIKSLLRISGLGKKEDKPTSDKFHINYDQYSFPAAIIKFDRGEINE